MSMGRRRGLEERPLAVVGAGGEEVEEHIVAVGGDDELTYRQAQQFGVISGKHIAEITGGHHEVHLVAHIDHLLFKQLCVSGEIIDDLRYETPHIDRIRRGKANMRVRLKA